MIPLKNPVSIPLPAGVVDLDAFDRNVDKLLSLAGDKKIRLATKSLRVPELIRRAMKRSPRFQGLMCYSAKEALFLAAQGFDDFLIAYPTVQASDLDAIRKLLSEGKQVALVVDSEEQLEKISQVLEESSQSLRCVVEVDMSLRLFGGKLHLGVRRSPVRSARQLAAFLQSSRKYRMIRVVGVMAYEAQVAGLGDRNPFKKWIGPIASLIRKISMRRIVPLRREIAEVFRAAGVKLELFNGGGTGSINLAAKEEALTELTAGSALYCPRLFDFYSNVSFEPAAFFALQVVRRSDEGFVTCQGGGYIASGEPGWDRVPTPHWPVGARLVGTEGCGEVQTPVLLPHGTRLSVGDAVWFRHSKAGELAERFNEFQLVREGAVTASAKTYRGFGESFF